MKYSVVLVACVLFAALFGSSSETSEQACGYINSEGEQIFLRYLTGLQRGGEYLDMDQNGNCVKKVTCLEDYNVQIEDC